VGPLWHVKRVAEKVARADGDEVALPAAGGHFLATNSAASTSPAPPAVVGEDQ